MGFGKYCRITAMSQDSPLSRLIGGRYQLEHRIARGGMAEVWLASDTFLHRQVAVKLVSTANKA